MAPLNDTDWSTDPAENAAIAALQTVICGMAQSLYAVPEARYVDLAGGFVAGQ